ncbi:MAG: hypothetical protein RIT01_162 [Pseudomonadota bacterium]|jgi:hypothetical protein
MKTQKEIEKLAEKYKSTSDFEIYLFHIGFIDGYTQCQEDIKQYIFEVAFQFHRLGKYYGNTSDTHFYNIYEKTIKLIKKTF